MKAIHEAFAIAIASTFWVSIGAAILAAVIVLFMPAVGRSGVAAGAPIDSEQSATR